MWTICACLLQWRQRLIGTPKVKLPLRLSQCIDSTSKPKFSRPPTNSKTLVHNVYCNFSAQHLKWIWPGLPTQGQPNSEVPCLHKGDLQLCSNNYAYKNKFVQGSVNFQYLLIQCWHNVNKAETTRILYGQSSKFRFVWRNIDKICNNVYLQLGVAFVFTIAGSPRFQF